MVRLHIPAICVGLVLIAVVVPTASAGIGTSPSRWSFKFDDAGVWHAQGDHVSFSWSLAPFEVYDVMIDGHMVLDELAFPADATGYMTEGATFKVMMGKTELFRLIDNSAGEMQSNCMVPPPDGDLPPGPCDVAFPAGSFFEVYPRGRVTQYHVEVFEKDPSGGNRLTELCVKFTTQGASSLDGTTIMFSGEANFRMPPGLIM